jgi:hypothetical protein
MSWKSHDVVPNASFTRHDVSHCSVDVAVITVLFISAAYEISSSGSSLKTLDNIGWFVMWWNQSPWASLRCQRESSLYHMKNVSDRDSNPGPEVIGTNLSWHMHTQGEEYILWSDFYLLSSFNFSFLIWYKKLKWVSLCCHQKTLWGFLRKTQKIHFLQKCLNKKVNGTIRKCSSRAFQWMVMSLCFDNLKFFGQFLWLVSPSLGDQSRHQSLNS